MIVTGISRGSRAEKIGEILFVGRLEQRLRRAADAKPGEGRERRIGGEPAAQRGALRSDVGDDIGEGQSAPPLAVRPRPPVRPAAHRPIA